ncbi:MAG: hypothetical protein HYV09_34310 [Deltaproteobacteria bacterium]|nr:hypothetical protein [Deltaproteobacteria bacterium]
MKRALFALALVVVACGKKDAPTDQPASKPAASAAPSVSAAAPKAAPITLKGAYASKRGEVRVASDAPAFVHPDSKDGLGEGELTITLPAGNGAATGAAKGALGAQSFRGWLEDGHLTGTLHPDEGSKPAMWGVVDATVEGSGDARSIKGTVRASGADGQVVREATFTLDKK